MRLQAATCAVLVRQFTKAVHPFTVRGDVHVVKMGHGRAILWSQATYSWGTPAICMTTRPWGPEGTKTENLYYKHADVNCWTVGH